MKFEVDQSVKIEQSGDSVLAISNSDWEAVVISGRVKTKLQNFLREQRYRQFITNSILSLSRLDGVKVRSTVLFSLIGRDSTAHKIAKMVKRGKKTARRLSFSEIQIQLTRLIGRQQKSRVESSPPV